jgi:hypothetical protein
MMEAAMVVLVAEEERTILIPVQKGCQALAKIGKMNHGDDECGRYLLPLRRRLHHCSNTTIDNNQPPTRVDEPSAVQTVEE